MSEVTRNRRTPAEIVAARETELANAKARAAVDAQMSHPLIAGLSEKLEGYTKDRIEAKKGWNGNPSQTFENRIKSHTLWNNEIQAEQKEAEAVIALTDKINPEIRALRVSIAEKLANGMSNEDAKTALESGMDAILEGASSLFHNLNEARTDLNMAIFARKEFIAGKKAKATGTATA